MKLTEKTLKKMIAEAITQATQMDLSKSDPNDNLFQIMDQVQDKAMKYLNITEEDRAADHRLDEQLSEMANEVVTSNLQNFILQMAAELVQKYLMKQESK
mgnify:CR=1 FL=1